jgi:uncharacterized protein YbaR (Trm112 family)
MSEAKPGVSPAIPGRLTETSLDLPEDITEDRAAECGRVLLRMHESSCWWLGDWFNFVQERFPQTWPQMVEATEYQERTLRKFGWMCRRIPRGKRYELLSPRHHEIVAPLPPEKQEEYLQKAAPEKRGDPPKLSTRELQEDVRAEPEADPGRPRNAETIEEVICPECGSVYPLRNAITRTVEV